ncbi:MAG: carbohydrate kinase family protein [Isosphaeraceae bacterium]|nr:carbohydrate kinase family protein [Isosphaeraceae bacterium]
MAPTRQEICNSTARKLAHAAAQGLRSLRAVIGFDGFVDEIIDVVDKRYGPGRYDPVRTITAMGDKIRAAAGESSNYELVVKRRKLGGNGPIMADALAMLGLDVTYIGNLGYPDLHLVFRDFAARARVLSIAEPGHTDALEFEDGKIMLGKHESLHEVNWENLVARVGLDELRRTMGEAALIGMVNWTMLPGMSRIWEQLLAEVFPGSPRRDRTIFIDLADPEKRTPEDIWGALGLLGRFQEHGEVILGLNLKEAMQVAAVLNLPSRSDPEAAIEEEAAAIRQALGLGGVVIHPRRAAAAATEQGSARFEGPFIKQPQISTGAGDHFNAGFCLGRALGLSLEENLCAGTAASGYYVRTAQSPTVGQLAEFISELPPPES